MKKKIHSRLILMSILAILITTISVTIVFYELFLEQVKKDLTTEAALMSEYGLEYLTYSEDILEKQGIRVTWIGEDGTVLYDNHADITKMENHLTRPEIKEALLGEKGESLRRSDTMGRTTFYYALLVEDGTIIRVATQIRSIVNLYWSVLPVVLLIICVVAIICIIVSHLLTRQLLKPIEKMAENIENYNQIPEYEELVPFVTTIRKQHEDILKSALQRQDFSANVSHELKTPLTAISGYAELIENHMVDGEQTIHFATEIRKNSQRLLALINDIIRLSQLDHSTIKEGFEKISIKELLVECLPELEEIARQKKVKISMDCEEVTLFANKVMIREMIYNLCQNGIIYNIEGGHLDIRLYQQKERVVFEVKDTGIGIPVSDQERIFERFYRVDKSRSRETGGTGLGLAIVKHIVELHNGEIGLESELGVGTCMKIYI